MPMCDPPGHRHDNFLKEQPGTPAIGGKGGAWAAKDMPMLLHTFEYIVRHALLKWWRSIAQPDIPETATDESLSA